MVITIILAMIIIGIYCYKRNKSSQQGIIPIKERRAEMKFYTPIVMRILYYIANITDIIALLMFFTCKVYVNPYYRASYVELYPWSAAVALGAFVFLILLNRMWYEIAILFFKIHERLESIDKAMCFVFRQNENVKAE